MAAPGRHLTVVQLNAITVIILNYNRNSIGVATCWGHMRVKCRWTVASNDWFSDFCNGSFSTVSAEIVGWLTSASP